MRSTRAWAQFAITFLTVCLPASLCYASVEPELTMAVGRRDYQQTVALLSEGANVNERDEGAEQTPLMRAAQVGDAQIAEALLERGAEVNARDDDGNTALMLAVEKGSTQVAQMLIAWGADPSAHNAAGQTAISLARGKERPTLTRLLRVALTRQNRNRPQQAKLRSAGPSLARNS